MANLMEARQLVCKLKNKAGKKSGRGDDGHTPLKNISRNQDE